MSNRGRMTVIFQPAGKLEEFFVTLAAFTKAPTPEQLAKLFIDHDMRVVGPPLPVD